MSFYGQYKFRLILIIHFEGMETMLQKKTKRGSHIVQTSYWLYKYNTFLLT